MEGLLCFGGRRKGWFCPFYIHNSTCDRRRWSQFFWWHWESYLYYWLYNLADFVAKKTLVWEKAYKIMFAFWGEARKEYHKGMGHFSRVGILIGGVQPLTSSKYEWIPKTFLIDRNLTKVIVNLFRADSSTWRRN